MEIKKDTEVLRNDPVIKNENVVILGSEYIIKNNKVIYDQAKAQLGGCIFALDLETGSRGWYPGCENWVEINAGSLLLNPTTKVKMMRTSNLIEAKLIDDSEDMYVLINYRDNIYLVERINIAKFIYK